MAQAELATKADVIRLIDACFANLKAETEAGDVRFTDVDYELSEQRRMVDERISSLRQQIGRGDFEPDVRAAAAEVLRRRGFAAAGSTGVSTVSPNRGSSGT